MIEQMTKGADDRAVDSIMHRTYNELRLNEIASRANPAELKERHIDSVIAGIESLARNRLGVSENQIVENQSESGMRLKQEKLKLLTDAETMFNKIDGCAGISFEKDKLENPRYLSCAFNAAVNYESMNLSSRADHLRWMRYVLIALNFLLTIYLFLKQKVEVEG